jgi:hypothetical protein
MPLTTRPAGSCGVGIERAWAEVFRHFSTVKRMVFSISVAVSVIAYFVDGPKICFAVGQREICRFDLNPLAGLFYLSLIFAASLLPGLALVLGVCWVRELLRERAQRKTVRAMFE